MSQVEKFGNPEIVQSTIYWRERGGLNLTWHEEFAKSVMNQDVLREKNQSQKTLRPQCVESFTRSRGQTVVKLSQVKQMILLAEGPASVLILWINFSELLLMEM